MAKLDEQMKAIEAGHLAPIYLLSGTEQYLIERVCSLIEKETIGTGRNDFNRIFFDLEHTAIEDVIFEASSLSFFNDRKLIIAHHAYFLSTKRPRGMVEHQTDVLSDYLKRPSPDTVLVLIAPYEKLDGRKKITKEVKRYATHLNLSNIKGYQASQMVQAYLKEKDYHIERYAWSLFEQLTSQNLTHMMKELEKLMLYHYEDHCIQKSSVEQLVAKNLEQNVFELNDLVLQLKVPEAMEMYQDLRAQKQEPIAIIALLINEFRLLLQTKILTQQGYSQASIAKTLAVHPYRVKLAMKKNKLLSLNVLARALSELIEFDYQMKIGKIDHDLVFEIFVMRFAEDLTEP